MNQVSNTVLGTQGRNRFYYAIYISPKSGGFTAVQYSRFSRSPIRYSTPAFVSEYDKIKTDQKYIWQQEHKDHAYFHTNSLCTTGKKIKYFSPLTIPKVSEDQIGSHLFQSKFFLLTMMKLFSILLLFTTAAFASASVSNSSVDDTPVNSKTIHDILHAERRLVLYNSRQLAGECCKLLLSNDFSGKIPRIRTFRH